MYVDSLSNTLKRPLLVSLTKPVLRMLTLPLINDSYVLEGPWFW